MMTEIELSIINRRHQLDARLSRLTEHERAAVEVLVIVLCQQIKAKRAEALEIVLGLGRWMRVSK